MTVITYRHGLMACDSAWSYNDLHVVSHIKIIRLKSGALLGSAGDNDSRAVYDLLQKVTKAKQLPSAKALKETSVDYAGILVLPSGEAWHIAIEQSSDKDGESGVWPALTKWDFAAEGCGRRAAIGAMFHDPQCSAERAAWVAANSGDPHCAPPIHVVPLIEPRRKK